MNDLNPRTCYRCKKEIQFVNCNIAEIEKFLLSFKENSLTDKAYKQLSDILKNYEDISQPLCHSCSNIYYEKFNKDLKLIQDKICWYEDILRTINTYGFPPKPLYTFDDSNIDLELDDLKLQCSEKDKCYQEEIKYNLKLDEIDKNLTKKFNLIKTKFLVKEDESLSLNNQLKCLESKINTWSNLDPLAFVFQIKFDGHFGIINEFRFGRISNIPEGNITWNEVNSAWGEVLHLLRSLSFKINFNFQGYKLDPKGSKSLIKIYSDNINISESQTATDLGKVLPLYYTSGSIKFFWDTKFDQAMVAFLECMKQISYELERKDPQFKLPYKIDKGRLYEPSSALSFSIKAQFNSEENWTKALKYTLTNMQWIQTCIISLKDI